MSEYLKAVAATFADPYTRYAAVFALVFFAAAGPFGTYDSMSFLQRFGFFLPIFLVSLPVAGVTCHWAHSRFAARPMLQQRVIAMTLFVAFFAPILHWYKLFYSGDDETFPYTMGTSFLMLGAVAVSIVAVLTVIDIEMARRQGSSGKPQQAKVPRLARRLPDIGDAAIMRITVDDHYVQVFLNNGQVERLLMRFADAVAEMDETPGFVTHRSHWVAVEAVEGLTRQGGRDFVRLLCGQTVPVSRSHRPTVLEAGIKEVV